MGRARIAIIIGLIFIAACILAVVLTPPGKEIGAAPPEAADVPVVK